MGITLAPGTESELLRFPRADRDPRLPEVPVLHPRRLLRKRVLSRPAISLVAPGFRMFYLQRQEKKYMPQLMGLPVQIKRLLFGIFHTCKVLG